MFVFCLEEQPLRLLLTASNTIITASTRTTTIIAAILPLLYALSDGMAWVWYGKYGPTWFPITIHLFVTITIFTTSTYFYWIELLLMFIV